MKLKRTAAYLAGILLLAIVAMFLIRQPMLAMSVDETRLPQFVTADFIDLGRIGSVSKFRSGMGHDYSGNGERCRSMKHYFMQPYDPSAEGNYTGPNPTYPAPDPATAVAIYSPVTGSIASISGERIPLGKQIVIKPDSAPGYGVKLFHVYPEENLKRGAQVQAGQKIGSIGKGQTTDVAVEARTLKGTQLVSYFQVMTDAVFANYQKAGAASRDQFVVTREYRDAHPLACSPENREQFAKNYTGTPDNDELVYLNGDSAERPGR